MKIFSRFSLLICLLTLPLFANASSYNLYLFHNGSEHGSVVEYTSGWGAGFGQAVTNEFADKISCSVAAKSLVERVSPDGKTVIESAKETELNGTFLYVRSTKSFDDRSLIAYCIPTS